MVKSEPERAKGITFDHLEAVAGTLVPLPPTWRSRELVALLDDSLGGYQRYRVVIAARPDAGGGVLVSLYAPETVVKAAPDFFTRLLASVH